MMHFDINKIRDIYKQLIPIADLESALTFYYDETNNIRKFYINEKGFNYSFQSNFVLGGIVYDVSEPDIEKLFTKLNLQNSTKDVKLKHLAKGDFLSCLKSHKLNYFLRFLLENDIYIHYSTVNLLYFSIVDIVDSALVNSKTAVQLGYEFSWYLKNILYKLTKLEINSVLNLLYRFQYPNIKRESVPSFISTLLELFKKYEYTSEFYIGLAVLKQILKESKKAKSLPFVMDEDDFVLLKDFSGFYLRPIYMFKNSTHIFDKEDSVEDVLSEFTLYDEDKILESYSFEDSKDSLYIQASDIFIGLVGKFSTFINTHSHTDIEISVNNLSQSQLESLDIYLDLIKKSDSKNIAFLLAVDSIEEMSKVAFLYEMRKGVKYPNKWDITKFW